MLANTKKTFVESVHPYKITHIEKGAKAGRWKTYIGKPRKEVVRRSESDLYNYLYDYYRAKEAPEPTFRDVFSERMDYLLHQKNRADKTMSAYWSIFNRFISKSFADKEIRKIKESDVLTMLETVYKATRPKQEALKKAVQQIKATFQFAIKKGYCSSNPAQFADPSDYYKDCDLTRKSAEEKEFSEHELALLFDDLMKDVLNPRALMALLAMETGMRQGELAAIHRSDVEDNFLHIHRQQILDRKGGSGQRYYEVPYTKDEKMRPHGGRRFPVTPRIRNIIALAAQIPGQSEYLFHDPDFSEAVKKDTYCKYLARHCRALGLTTTNNHAFRVALNSKLIAEGFSPADRALLLGHAVETNERNYSVADSRRLDDISRRMQA